ncbi:hypothetical protein [Brevibacterium oceani]|uniref:hypothetical protein n=1 Tax=Brevibacterium oceani TaxID=358099 RepID=UPI001B328E1B|nr:hypothetical protein [Brevibacterium oceani]
MSDRRILVTDAAITLIATRGMRSVTHRAIDDYLGIPLGSAVNVAKNRQSLLAVASEGVCRRLDARCTQALQAEDNGVTFCTALACDDPRVFRAFAILSFDPEPDWQSKKTLRSAFASLATVLSTLAGITEAQARMVLGSLLARLACGPARAGQLREELPELLRPAAPEPPCVDW